MEKPFVGSTCEDCDYCHACVSDRYIRGQRVTEFRCQYKSKPGKLCGEMHEMYIYERGENARSRILKTRLYDGNSYSGFPYWCPIHQNLRKELLRKAKEKEAKKLEREVKKLKKELAKKQYKLLNLKDELEAK